MTIPTRERIIEEALRLFAEKGYSATAVSEIEAAAGLSPGAGGLYRHFRSKEEVLAAAVRAHAARTTDQIEVTLHSAAAAQLTPLPDRLRYLCELGLAKMSEEANLIRVIFRDLDQFPQLVDEFREDLVQPLYEIMTAWGCPAARVRRLRHRLAGHRHRARRCGRQLLAHQHATRRPTRTGHRTALRGGMDEPRAWAAAG